MLLDIKKEIRLLGEKVKVKILTVKVLSDTKS